MFKYIPVAIIWTKWISVWGIKVRCVSSGTIIISFWWLLWSIALRPNTERVWILTCRIHTMDLRRGGMTGIIGVVRRTVYGICWGVWWWRTVMNWCTWEYTWIMPRVAMNSLLCSQDNLFCRFWTCKKNNVYKYVTQFLQIISLYIRTNCD
jgi:hypothetical protein